MVDSADILVKSIKQKHVADSSAEAELMALHECVKHLIYIISIYEELGFHQIGVPQLYMFSCINKNQRFHEEYPPFLLVKTRLN